MSSNEFLIGFAGLGRLLESGVDFPVLGPRLEARLAADPSDANAMLDVSTLLFLSANPEFRAIALDRQRRALEMRQAYRLAPPAGSATVRLLVLMAPGDMTSNTPVDCLLEGADIDVTLLYVLPGCPLPAPLPEHDVVFVAIGESTANQVLLQQLVDLPKATSKPIVNMPDRITRVVRDRACELLESVPGAVMPATVQIARHTLASVARQTRSLDEVLAGGRFPIIARPVDSQGGKGLEKLDGIADLSGYLDRLANDAYFISNFIDYRSTDGQFKKLRVVLIDGHPFACHMGISSHWMIHYVNANMDESAAKRAEEERFFATFEREFAKKHRQCLAEISNRLGLDYVGIDCAEMPDGRLLIFEVDNAAIVHAFDDPKLYPYKQPAMRKVFDAFRAMLVARAHRSKNGARRAPASG